MLGHLKTNLIYPLAEQHQQRDISSKKREIESDLLLTGAARSQRIKAQIHKTLKIAQEKVPYYTDLFKKIDFDPNLVLKDLRHLQELPFLTKEILREHEDRLINVDLKKESLHLRKTGGSTGPCTSIYYDQHALDWTAAVNLHALSLTGRKSHQLECYISPLASSGATWKDKVKHWVLHRHNTQAHVFDDVSLKALWTELKEKKPFVIHGHPSILYALAKFVEKSGITEKLPVNAFESTGESLDKKKIESIETYLGCKVYNRYGNAEFGVVAHSKEDPSRLEVIDYICHPEAISLGNGLDEIVLTTTTNTAMPLIRYKTGDIGQLVKEDGRNYLCNIQGRIHDLIDIKGKLYSTHYIQGILDQSSGMDEFQVVERSNGSKLFKIVPNGQTNEKAIRDSLLGLFGTDNIEIAFTNFEGLSLTGWRDKFRYVIKEV